MSDYADDVATLLDELKIKRAVIGGASMGGYAALAFLRLAGDRVDGLVLANTRAGADSLEARANRRNHAGSARSRGPVRSGAGDDAEAARQDHPRDQPRD